MYEYHLAQASKLPDDLLQVSTKLAESLHLSRAAYIRRALEPMNEETEQQPQGERMRRASLKVRKESMAVNAEFR